MPGAPALRNVAGDLIAVLDWCLVNGSTTTAVQSIVVSGSVATVTFSSSHSFRVHQIIEIAGVTGAMTALNSQWRATGVTSLALTFAATGIANGTAAGTITCKTPALTWQKAFSGTNKAAYRSQDVTGSRFYLRIDDTGTTTANARGYESMTSVDSGVNGYWRLTGNTIGKSDSATPFAWFVVGDTRAFYFQSQAPVGTSSVGRELAFGDAISFSSVDAYSTWISGDTSETGVLDSSSNAGSAFWARTIAGVAQGGSAFSKDDAGTSTYPNAADGALHFRGGRVAFHPVNGSARALLPGMLTVVEAANNIESGTIVDQAGYGFDGLVMLLSGSNVKTSPRSAIDLVGPWR
jgi:hypothetical protein